MWAFYKFRIFFWNFLESSLSLFLPPIFEVLLLRRVVTCPCHRYQAIRWQNENTYLTWVHFLLLGEKRMSRKQESKCWLNLKIAPHSFYSYSKPLQATGWEKGFSQVLMPGIAFSKFPNLLLEGRSAMLIFYAYRYEGLKNIPSLKDWQIACNLICLKEGIIILIVASISRPAPLKTADVTWLTILILFCWNKYFQLQYFESFCGIKTILQFHFDFLMANSDFIARKCFWIKYWSNVCVPHFRRRPRPKNLLRISVLTWTAWFLTPRSRPLTVGTPWTLRSPPRRTIWPRGSGRRSSGNAGLPSRDWSDSSTSGSPSSSSCPF